MQYHTVKYGDTLNSIAKQFSVEKIRLQHLNSLTDSDELLPGSTLRLPSPERDHKLTGNPSLVIEKASLVDRVEVSIARNKQAAEFVPYEMASSVVANVSTAANVSTVTNVYTTNNIATNTALATTARGVVDVAVMAHNIAAVSAVATAVAVVRGIGRA